VSKPKKTLGMRVLERAGVAYDVIEYPEAIHDALGVAEFAGEPPERVYKTLVVEPVKERSKPVLVMIAADRTLNLKALAGALGVKRAEMASHADAERLTGLKVGGISALALTGKNWDVYIDGRALAHDTIIISAGQRGIDLRVPVEGFIRATGARPVDAAE
jgi:Cys-tRNA(Pro)/Cys-tRNA(Cys) deacylase